ncbi:hypothetical protein AAGS61_08605 [Lysinibacillus sp. KU-BSD001]|uniref:hypothetical protein n=1 Tax=Lysinibacillus sp. KU-BSD001 TaxID=3141328 RepID=UPI0036EB9FAC
MSNFNVKLRTIFKNNYFKFIKWIVILILLFKVLESQIYIDVLIEVFGEFGAIIYSLSFFTLSLIFTALLLVSFGWLFKKTDLLLDKTTSPYNSTLYTWLGEDAVSSKFLRNMFGDGASSEYDDTENLKEITNIIKTKLEDNLLYFKIFRTFLYSRTKKSLFNKINVYLITLLATFITTLFIPKIKEYITNKVGSQEIFKIIDELTRYQIHSYLILYTSIAFTVYFLTYQVLFTFTERNRRINFLISILDILIEEKENNNNIFAQGSTSHLEDNNR